MAHRVACHDEAPLLQSGVSRRAPGAAARRPGRDRRRAGERLIVRRGTINRCVIALHASGRILLYTGFALRPPRSIVTGASPCAIRRAARSSRRLANICAPSASSGEARTMATLFSMSSCDQPRECAT